MSSGCASSADQTSALHALEGHADFSFAELVAAYLDCLCNKRNTPSARAFEIDQETNLYALYMALRDGTYRPGRSTCFVITRPKPREVWAAPFVDRIVHHLLYNHIAERFHRAFIIDSCACIPGRGTLYAAERLEAKIRSVTQNWSQPAYYLKLDLANFFVSIHRPTLRGQLAARIPEPWWMALAELILFHDPRPDVDLRIPRRLLACVPPHKSLFNQPPERGLPIGNLSSQFFANVYLDALDQFVKHRLHARYYIRYVDDFLLLHESAQWLNAALEQIEAFLPRELQVRLNPAKTILQPIARGVDFVGQVIKPWCRRTRRRTVRAALDRLTRVAEADLYVTANSYFGHLGQASNSHTDRARLANLLRRRGRSVDHRLTKSYRPGTGAAA